MTLIIWNSLLFYRRTLCQGTGLHLKKKLDSHLHEHSSLDCYHSNIHTIYALLYSLNLRLLWIKNPSKNPPFFRVTCNPCNSTACCLHNAVDIFNVLQNPVLL